MQILSTPIGKSVRREAWGIDIGNSGVKAICLQLDQHDAPAVVRCISTPHAPALHTVADEPARQEIIRATIVRLSEEAEVTRGTAVVGLPGLKTIGRFFDIPKMKAKKLTDAIAYEAKVQIPIPLEHISYDYHFWDDDHARLQSVALFAARREHVKQLLNLFTDSSFEVVAVQPTFVALFNAGCSEFLDVIDSDKTIGILDVGSDASMMVAGNKRRLRYRSLTFGTDRMSRILADRFKLSRPKSEQLLANLQSAQWMYQIDRELSRPLEEFVSEIQRTLTSFHNDGVEVSQIVVTGGGSLQHGLIRYLICGE